MKDWIKSISEQSGLPFDKILIVAVLLHLLSVVVSISYHHPDEHFQILEFANYKLGKSPGTDLPWEFREQMRPAIQPAFVVGLVQFCEAIGIHSPFIWAALLRFLSMFAALGTVFLVGICMKDEFKTMVGRKWFWLGSFFLWFMPYLHIRFTSENIGGILFTIALCSIAYKVKERWWTYSGIGFLLSMAVFIRFQLGFGLLGVGLWLLFVRRLSLANWLGLILGGLIALAINLGVDYWFYGEWVFTPYAYFEANIIEDKASNFGVSPWYYYFGAFIVRVLPPLSLILLGFFFYGLLKNKRSVWLWSFIPFLLGHMAVGHKELRFLYPYLYYLPAAIALAMEDIFPKLNQITWQRLLHRFSVGQNLIVLLLVLTPWLHKQIGFNEYYLRFLYHYGEKHESVALLSVNENPFEFYDLEMNFYKSQKIVIYQFDTISSVKTWLEDNYQKNEVLLYWRGFSSPPPLKGYRLVRLHRSFPEWARHINILNFQEGVPTRGIYRVEALNAGISNSSSPDVVSFKN